MRNSSPAVIAGYSASSRRCWWRYWWRFLKPEQMYLYLSHTYIQIYARICVREWHRFRRVPVCTHCSQHPFVRGKAHKRCIRPMETNGYCIFRFRMIVENKPPHFLEILRMGSLRSLYYRSAVHGLIDLRKSRRYIEISWRWQWVSFRWEKWEHCRASVESHGLEILFVFPQQKVRASFLEDSSVLQSIIRRLYKWGGNVHHNHFSNFLEAAKAFLFFFFVVFFSCE